MASILSPSFQSCGLVSCLFRISRYGHITHGLLALNRDITDVEEAGVKHSSVDLLGSRESKDGLAANELLVPVDSPLEVRVGDENVEIVGQGPEVTVLGSRGLSVERGEGHDGVLG